LITLLLYAIVTLILLAAWSRHIQGISGGAALALMLLPLCFTGRALLTGAVYAPIDLPFMSEPLHSYRADYGVTEIHNGHLSDLYQQIIPWRKAVTESLLRREWPLWNRHMLCGDILAAAAQPAPFDPFNLVALLIPVGPGLTFSASITFFLAAFSAFVFARSLGCKNAASCVAAAGWMCSAGLTFFVGWPIGRAWALLPLVLSGVRMVAGNASRMRAGVVLTLAFVLEILAGHPETLLHVVAIGAVYGMFELARHRSLRAIAVAFTSGLIALGITAIFLLPFLEAAPQSVQDGLRKYGASMPFAAEPDSVMRRTRTTLLPFDPDRDREPDSGGAGFAIIGLSLLALVTARRRSETWLFFALAIVCGLAGVNAPPVANALHALPLFDIAVNQRLAFGADFFLAILAALAVDSVRLDAQSLIVGLVLFERLIEAGSIYPTIPARAFYPRVPSIAAIPQSTEPFRIAALNYQFIPDAAVFYGLEDARGYSAMNNLRLAATFPLWCTQQPVSYNLIPDASRPFLSFLNIRYLLTPLDSDVPPGWKLITQDRGSKLIENTNVLPRAFIPRTVRYQPSAQAVLNELLSANDFAGRAWIEVPSYPPQDVLNGTGRVAIKRAKLGYKLTADMEANGWIVISETAWDGWRAYIDGRRVKISYANHAFLGVHVPAGHHRVRLIYLPVAFTRGRAITFATLALLAIGALARRINYLVRAAPLPGHDRLDDVRLEPLRSAGYEGGGDRGGPSSSLL